MNVCFQLIVFNGAPFLEPCLRALRPYGQIVVTEGPVAFYARQGFTTSTDDTSQVLARLVGEQNVVHGVWPEKDEMLWAGERLIPPDTEFVWAVDADEVYTSETLEKMLTLLATDQWDSVEFRPYSFYGGFDRYMTGYEQDPPCGWHRIQRWTGHWHTHRPPTVLAPDGRPWREHRHMTRDLSEKLAGRFFHYSYVLPSQMRAKAAYYHSKGGTIPHYFERVYLPWVRGDDAYKQAIENAFDGVHDILPERRGPCRTRVFKGEHPETIREILPALRTRFARELEACR